MKVLIDTISLEKINKMKEISNFKDLIQLNENNNSNFHCYYPWMSLWFSEVVKQNLSFFSDLGMDTLVLSNSQKLEYLNSIFTVDCVPLKLINSSANNLEVISSDEKKINRFQEKLNSSLHLIKTNDPLMEKYFKSLISNIILREKKDKNDHQVRANGTGLSSHFFRGAIFLSLPEVKGLIEIDLAINIVHEIGHHVLMNYQRFDRIIKDDFLKLSYSSIRKTKRPGILAFHALVASYFILRFIQRLVKSNELSASQKLYLHSSFNSLFIETEKSLESFLRADLTQLGRKMFFEISQFINSINLKDYDREISAL